MMLKEYLAIHNVSIGEFAEKINYTRGHVSGVVNKRRHPSTDMAMKIVQATNGLVTYGDLYYENFPICPTCKRILSATYKGPYKPKKSTLWAQSPDFITLMTDEVDFDNPSNHNPKPIKIPRPSTKKS